MIIWIVEDELQGFSKSVCSYYAHLSWPFYSEFECSSKIEQTVMDYIVSNKEANSLFNHIVGKLEDNDNLLRHQGFRINANKIIRDVANVSYFNDIVSYLDDSTILSLINEYKKYDRDMAMKILSSDHPTFNFKQHMSSTYSVSDEERQFVTRKIFDISFIHCGILPLYFVEVVQFTEACEAMKMILNSSVVLPDVVAIDIDFKKKETEFEYWKSTKCFMSQSTSKVNDSAPLGWFIAAAMKMRLMETNNCVTEYFIYSGKDHILTSLLTARQNCSIDEMNINIPPFLNIYEKVLNAEQESITKIIDDHCKQVAKNNVKKGYTLLSGTEEVLWELLKTKKINEGKEIISIDINLSENLGCDKIERIHLLFPYQYSILRDSRSELSDIISCIEDILNVVKLDYNWELCKAFKKLNLPTPNEYASLLAKCCHGDESINEESLNNWFENECDLPFETKARIKSQAKYYDDNVSFGGRYGRGLLLKAFATAMNTEQHYRALNDTVVYKNWMNNISNISNEIGINGNNISGNFISGKLLTDWNHLSIILKSLIDGSSDPKSATLVINQLDNIITIKLSLTLSEHLSPTGLMGSTICILDKLKKWGHSYYKASVVFDLEENDSSKRVVKLKTFPIWPERNADDFPQDDYDNDETPHFEINIIFENYLKTRSFREA